MKPTGTMPSRKAAASLLVAAFLCPAAQAAQAAAEPTQDVLGELATPLEVPVTTTQQGIDAHQALTPLANGLVTWSFAVRPETRGGRFSLGEGPPGDLPGTSAGLSTFGIVFLDRPMGELGAKVLLVVDERVNGVESGAVPARAQSAFVYTTHGLNRVFHYRARA